MRTAAAQYPYDTDDPENVLSLRHSTKEVAEAMRQSIQEAVEVAGIEIIEAKISTLSYAVEIMEVMLRQQQAQALIDARKLIVNGAVDMVQMAIEEFESNNTVALDKQTKADMACKLLIILAAKND